MGKLMRNSSNGLVLFMVMAVLLVAFAVSCSGATTGDVWSQDEAKAKGEKAGEKVEAAAKDAKESSESWTGWAMDKISENLRLKSDDAKDAATKTKDTITHTASETGQYVGDKAGDVKDGATHKASEAKGKACETAGEAKEKTKEAAEEAENKATGKEEEAMHVTGEATEKGNEAYYMAKEKAYQEAVEAKEKAGEKGNEAYNKVVEAKDKAKKEGFDNTPKSKAGETIESAKQTISSKVKMKDDEL